MSRKFWYTIIALTIVIMVGFTLSSISSAKTALKEDTLISELKQLRSAVMMFKLERAANPETLLEALSNKANTLSPMLNEMKAQSVLNDPFGNPYQYNKETGWVNSSTEAYKSW
jgi:hypothetical protein